MPFLKAYVIFYDMNPLYFFSSNITYFLQKQPIKVEIFRIFAARVKVHQISNVIFQTKSQFFFKVWIFFCVMTDISSETLYVIEKSSTLKCKLSELPLLTLHIKIHQIAVIFETESQLFFKLWTLFSVKRHNSFVLFRLNFYMLWAKEAHQSANFQTFDCSHEN